MTLEMPIGIMLFNEDYYIEWTNPFLASCFSEDSLAGRSLYDVADSIVPLIKQEIESGDAYAPSFGNSRWSYVRKASLLF